jgi:biopolymer transport protein ExbD
MALGKLSEDEGGEGAIFAEINITPLTDIFLVLLIIFMVSSSVIVEHSTRTGVKVNLPKGATKEIDQRASSLVVSVMVSGEIIVNGSRVQSEDLTKLFTSHFAKDAQTQVIIEADEGVKHGQVVAIMNVAKQVGLSRLAIATKGGGGK